MVRRPIPVVINDFNEVLSFLSERRVVTNSPSAEMIINAKQIHSLTYSLILWRFRLRRLPEHSKVFVEEIASDAIQILPQVLMGYGKTAKLLIRGIIENAFRHIYFSDHPIEYERMNREKRWFLTFDNLCEYTKAHPYYLKTEPQFDAIAQLTSLYSDLSAGVHGRTVRDLEMRRALRKIYYDHASATSDVERLKKCVAAVNFLIAIFHICKVRAFSAEDRRIVLRSMPVRARMAWNDHD